MAEIKNSEYDVTYNCNAEIKDAVFNEVMQFFLKHEAFSGEVIIQTDDTIIEAPGVLAEIADRIIEFKVTWKE